MSPSGVASAGSGTLAERLDELLPQTQCTRCGYPSCGDYAEALAAGETAPNRCPPGEQDTADALARLLGSAPMPLDPACGGERPWVVARVDETACIGCTLCIQACPVDAILGAAKHMHTVIASECTGCELCLAPCPVDCIVLEPMAMADIAWAVGADRQGVAGEGFLHRWMRERAPTARRRFQTRQERLRRLRAERARRRRERHSAMPGRDADLATKQAVIRHAVERVLRRRRGAPCDPS